ncbi:S1 RNA-binding domain-containing protein [Candidatus Woesearchaeota archaeon]|nr:S1 RNA-binding domain-containing protein [Candidatus Woesearchaeota archaeon]
MFYKKKGLPEENSVVLCTVKKILFHSIFADLDEYEHQEGMIHISEIAPGRIRNIRDYVIEGKKLVCQVLRVDQERRQVDLSLRRVPLSLRTKKNEEYKQEIKSEKLLEYIGKELKLDLNGIYQKMGFKLIDHFGLLGIAFNEIAIHGKEAITELNFPEKEVELLVTIVQDKIKPPEVIVNATLVLQSFSEKGIEDIKEALQEGEKFAKKNEIQVNMVYISAPNYRIEVTSNEYKTAEDELEEVTQVIIGEMKKRKALGEVIRKK